MQLKTLTCIMTSILFIACNQDTKMAIDTSQSINTNSQDTIYLERNSNINQANAYSDLFMDSTQLNQFLSKEKLGEQEKQRFQSFYNYRNLQYAWFTSQGLTEQARGFWNLQDKLGYKTNKALRDRMDSLLNHDSSARRFDSTMLQTELALTKAYLDFYSKHRDQTQLANTPAEKAIPAMRMNSVAIADSILGQKNDTAHTGARGQYALLKQKIKLYSDLLKNGDSLPLKIKPGQLKKGSSSSLVVALKKKLQQTGNIPHGDTSALYNDSLELAIKNFQQQHGLQATGTINDSLINEINTSPTKRLQQLIINLYRAQWMPALEETSYLWVNIPDFTLTVFENDQKAFEMPVAVGKEGTNTTMFTGNLNQVVFSPIWNIPRSIVKNEIMPKMKSNPNYLESQNMEIVNQNDSVPTIRQLPGKGNAMGRVKFLFPNRYDIYLHDTYNKEIFNRQDRAISHGCIRLADAEKLAEYLLRNDKNWTPEKIRSAMEGQKEQYAKVSPAVPVRITYFTAWVNESRQLEFAKDIYQHDEKIARMLFEDGSNGNVATTGKQDSTRTAGR